MTSDEIKEIRVTDLSTNTWLKEIAYQLALLNEKKDVPKQQTYGNRPRPN